MNGFEKYPSHVLQDAVEAIKSLPGVGSRSAMRLALHLLGQPAENIHRFASAIDHLASDVHYCKCCSMVCDGDICPICGDSRRNASQICVVENVRDVMSIEETGQYHGVYHVLGGIISPIAGVAPSDLTISALVDRVRALVGGDVPQRELASGNVSLRSTPPSLTAGPLPLTMPRVARFPETTPVAESLATGGVSNEAAPAAAPEIILALSGDVEGETTSFYIYRQLEPLGVKVTTLARGLGFGDNLEYADAVTLGRSLLNRQIFKV